MDLRASLVLIVFACLACTTKSEKSQNSTHTDDDVIIRACLESAFVEIVAPHHSLLLNGCNGDSYGLSKLIFKKGILGKRGKIYSWMSNRGVIEAHISLEHSGNGSQAANMSYIKSAQDVLEKESSYDLVDRLVAQHGHCVNPELITKFYESGADCAFMNAELDFQAFDRGFNSTCSGKCSQTSLAVYNRKILPELAKKKSDFTKLKNM